VSELSLAFALAVPHGSAAYRDDVGFFQAVHAILAKRARRAEARGPRPRHPPDRRRAVARRRVDIFSAAGLKKPDISILSDEFLAEVRGMPQRNLAVELLQKLLKGEIKTRAKRNVVQSRSFAELLEQSLRRYQNRAIETAKVIEELIQLAKEMRAAGQRGEALGLSDDEVAFYDALETNDSAVKVLGDDALRTIARELVATVRTNVTIDWTLRDNVRAHLRVLVKRILRKYGYPPDKQEKATQTVLEQAEVLSRAGLRPEEEEAVKTVDDSVEKKPSLLRPVLISGSGRTRRRSSPWLARPENLRLLATLLDPSWSTKRKKWRRAVAADLLGDSSDDSWAYREPDQEDRPFTSGSSPHLCCGVRQDCRLDCRHFTEEHRAALDWLN
jgi:hypothetical protein